MKRPIYLAPVVPALLLLGGCGTSSTTKTDTETTVIDNGAGFDAANMVVSNDVGDTALPDAADLTPQQFADTVAASDAYEVAAGKLAETRATTQALKSFGAQMVKDHTGSTAQLKAAAKDAAPPVTPDPTLSPDAQAKLTALKDLDGPGFDAAYREQQIAAHEKALALLQSYAASGGDPKLKQFASETAPKVQGHLDTVRGL